jgi:chorismate synthase
MFRFVTAGESHGKCLTGVVEGLPAGLGVDSGYINLELHRRQLGYGRGGRMQIEEDQIEFTAGIRHGKTLGSPICFSIRNRDWSHWEIPMSAEPVQPGVNVRPLTRPRPGHADLAGSLKYQTHDARNILERASARETAARVAVGALCKLFIKCFGVEIGSHVPAIGSVSIAGKFEHLSASEILAVKSDSALRCVDPAAEQQMMALIDHAKASGDTLGGVLEVIAVSVPAGLGSHTQWDRKLDGRLAQALMSIPAAKAVEIGSGVAAAAICGSEVQDEIFYDEGRRAFYRKTNRAGGMEGGISNGADIRVTVYMKPIPTLRKPLMSVDVVNKQPSEAAFERSDTCVVPAAAVIAESMVAVVLTQAFMEKFGGDSMDETQSNFQHYLKLVTDY